MLRKVPGGSDPEQFAISKDGKLLYVSNEDAAGLSFVDPANGQVLKTVPTGREPEGVTLSPDGKYVYVTSEDEGTVTVVDTAAQERREEDQGGTPPARHRIPARRLARVHHQRERRDAQRDRHRRRWMWSARSRPAREPSRWAWR